MTSSPKVYRATSTLRMRVTDVKVELSCPDTDAPCGGKHALKLGDSGIMTIERIRELA